MTWTFLLDYSASVLYEFKIIKPTDLAFDVFQHPKYHLEKVHGSLRCFMPG